MRKPGEAPERETGMTSAPAPAMANWPGEWQPCPAWQATQPMAVPAVSQCMLRSSSGQQSCPAVAMRVGSVPISMACRMPACASIGSSSIVTTILYLRGPCTLAAYYGTNPETMPPTVLT